MRTCASSLPSRVARVPIEYRVCVVDPPCLLRARQQYVPEGRQALFGWQVDLKLPFDQSAVAHMRLEIGIRNVSSVIGKAGK